MVTIEEGFPIVSEHKQWMVPSRGIQIGCEFEAKLLVLACSEALEGKSVD